MRKFLCVIAVLGMVGLANAAVDWDGDYDGDGDGWNFNNGLNWDDNVNPSGDSWNIFRRYPPTYPAYPPPMNLDIHVTSNISTSTGTIYNVTGYTYTVKLTVDNGVTMTMGSSASPAGLTYNSAGLLTVKSDAFLDMRYGTLGLENSGLTTVIEEDGRLFCSALRHNNGTKMDVYGLLEAWSVNRISADPGYSFNVYDGGEFVVYSGVPIGPWSRNGMVTMFLNSTVTLDGDHSAPADYLTKVQAGEPGTWQVEYSNGWTTIMLVPEPASLLLLGLSCLAMFRRRRA